MKDRRVGSVITLRACSLAVVALALTSVVGCGQAEPGSGPRVDAMVFQGGPAQPVREPVPCRVTRIVDGDTVHCEPVGRIRLIGMDTPERGQRPFGPMATEALEALIPVGSAVQIEGDVEATDQYGRVLGYVWTDGRMVNWLLVRAGYAVVLTYPPNVQHVDSLRSAQTRARREGRGLWAVDGFACEPRDYRRGVCGGG